MQTELRAAELIEVLGAYRRAVRRRVAAGSEAGLSTSEVELLRLVAKSPGIRSGQAAQALRLAPNSVSTLIARVATKGLLERRSDAADGRGAVLHVSPSGAAKLRRWRDRREELVAAALAGLDAFDRETLTACVDPLRRLVAALEA